MGIDLKFLDRKKPVKWIVYMSFTTFHRLQVLYLLLLFCVCIYTIASGKFTIHLQLCFLLIFIEVVLIISVFQHFGSQDITTKTNHIS